MRRPSICVLLPVLDAMPYLERVLLDLRHQTFADLEVVAVDDGSTDGSRELLLETAAQDPRIRPFFPERCGPAGALDLALARSDAALIGQAEADDLQDHRRFERLHRELTERPELDGVVSAVGLCGDFGEGMQRFVDWQNELRTPEELHRAQFVEIPAMHQSGLYRRSLFDRIGGFSSGSRWPVDLDFWARALAAGARVAKVPEVLYTWRQHAAQSTRRSSQHGTECLRRGRAHHFARGPGRNRDVLLVSTGRTLEVWSETLGEGPVRTVRTVEWRPGRGPAPARPTDGLRLFVFGVAAVRARIRSELGADHPDDWFGA